MLVPRDVDQLRAEFVTQISLHNACIAFHDDQYSMYRPQLVVDGPLDSPIVVHGFSEYASGYMRLGTVRQAGSHERRGIDMCNRAPIGLGVPVSHPTSIYHQLFHAVPSWLALRAVVAGLGLGTDAPAGAFVPLMYASAAVGRGKPASPWRWHAWELSVRPLTKASFSELAATATGRLLCMHTHMHAYRERERDACMHTQRCMRSHTCTRTCTRTHKFTRTRTRTRTHTRT